MPADTKPRRCRTHLALVVALLAVAVAPPAAALAGAGRKPLPIGSRLYDFGVADINHDGRLDVFATAHENAARGLLSHGRGFRAAPTGLGFGEDRHFPGLGNTDRPPTEHKPGTYVYVHRVDAGEKDLYLRIDAHRRPAVLDLTLTPKRDVKHVRVKHGTVEADHGGRNSSSAHVELDRGGSARIKVNLDLPIGFHSDGRTYVGSNAVRPDAADFSLRLADSHADVFADLNGDGSDDLLRVVGGLGGGIAKPRLRGQVKDVTRLWSAGGYRDAELGLDKDDCRGRQAAALDVDGNGLTDVFESCAGHKGSSAARPVVEFAQPGGGFDRQLVPVHGDVYRWVPSPAGHLPELLVLDRRATLWKYSGGRWRRAGGTELRGRPSQTTLGDFDADGGPDVYVSSLRGSTLLRIGAHSIRAQKPGRLGLPTRTDAASWVDADGNGSLDLHAVPGGLYTRHGKRFRPTGELASGGRYAHVSWADFDNNGLREPVFAQTDGEFTIKARAWWYGLHPLRRHARRPWLEVATPGNWLAAKIVVAPNHGRRRIGWAGEAETSRYSQGHNRAYFTLPPGSRRARISVRTADGKVHRLRTRRNRVVSFAG